VTILQQFQNSESRKGGGFETGAEWGRSAFSLLGQYAYQKFRDKKTDAVILRDTPRHKVSAAVRFQKGPLDLDVWAHRVSETTADDGYFLLNPRLALRRGSWQVAVSGFNVTDDRHIETINNGNVKGEILRRAVAVNVSYGFGLGQR
jgi:hypothetical protein